MFVNFVGGHALLSLDYRLLAGLQRLAQLADLGQQCIFLVQFIIYADGTVTRHNLNRVAASTRNISARSFMQCPEKIRMEIFPDCICRSLENFSDG